MSNISTKSQYSDFVLSIKQRILQSQYEALKSVNKELISLYWDIGKNIVEKQDEFGWGKSVVKNLAEDLQQEFVGIKDFSVQNLWNMRLFYLEYRNSEKLQTLSREIAWSHNMAIIQKCKNDLEREFYIQMVKRYSWTYRVLVNHIENKSYEKFLLNQTNFDETVPLKYQDQAKLAVKDENPSIGIIICKDKNRTVVEYALKDTNKPIGISSYRLLHKLPSSLQSFFPSPEEIVERLSVFDEQKGLK